MNEKLIVTCPEHLENVRLFADQINQRDRFERCLDRLTICLPDLWTTELYADFAPYSFLWSEFSPSHHRGLSGGLIFHGKHDRGGDGGAPTFSVNLTPSHGWQIHT